MEGLPWRVAPAARSRGLLQPIVERLGDAVPQRGPGRDERVDFAVAEREPPLVGEAKRLARVAQEVVTELFVRHEVVDEDCEGLVHVDLPGVNPRYLDRDYAKGAPIRISRADPLNTLISHALADRRGSGRLPAGIDAVACWSTC